MAVAAIFILLVWVALSAVAAEIADGKGLSQGQYFAIAFFFSPVIGILAAVISTADKAALDRRALVCGGARNCPFCAEIIKLQAIVCPHCQRDLPKPPPKAPPKAAAIPSPAIPTSRREKI